MKFGYNIHKIENGVRRLLSRTTISLPEDYIPTRQKEFYEEIGQIIPVDRYETNLNYKIEELGSYYVKVDISCRQKSEAEAETAKSVVKKRVGLFDKINTILASFFSALLKTTSFPESSIPETSKQRQILNPPFVTIVAPTGTRTLQLGSFYFFDQNPPVRKACKELLFEVY